MCTLIESVAATIDPDKSHSKQEMVTTMQDNAPPYPHAAGPPPTAGSPPWPGSAGPAQPPAPPGHRGFATVIGPLPGNPPSDQAWRSRPQSPPPWPGPQHGAPPAPPSGRPGDHDAGRTGSAARRIRGLAPLVLDVAVPLGAYLVLHALGWSATAAYAGAVGASVLCLGVSALVKRHFDVIAAAMLAMFTVQLLVSLVTGSLRLSVGIEALTSAIGATVLLVSCAVGRPIFQTFAMRVAGTTPERAAAMWHRWSTQPAYRRLMTRLTLVSGAVLGIESVVRLVLIATLPPGALVGASRGLQMVTLVGLIGWAILYGRRSLRRGSAVRV
jgi:hypothetical protein